MNKIICLSILYILGITTISLAQRPDSNKKGNVFFEANYNRSGYTNSDVKLESNNYKIALEDVALSDTYEGKSMKNYFSGSSPQFGARMGYYVANNWAITFAYDRYNIFFKQPQNVILNGTFAPASNSNYAGTYLEEIELHRNEFDIAQHGASNFFSFGFIRNDQWYKSRNNQFTIQTIYGIKIGTFYTGLDYVYDGHREQGVTSFGGLGISANISLRIEFFQHVYLSFGVDGGLIRQENLNIYNKDKEAKASLSTVFLAPTIGIGFSFHTSKDCGTCPQW